MGAEAFLNLKGKSISHLFGKTYFVMNQERIHYRPNHFKKEEVLNWDEVKRICNISGKILIYSKSDQWLELDYSRFTYPGIQEIKEALRETALKREIEMA